MEVMGLIIRGLFCGVVSVKAAMWKICGDVVPSKMGEAQGLRKLSPQNPDTRHVDILPRIT
jgi:hypothetical protein